MVVVSVQQGRSGGSRVGFIMKSVKEKAFIEKHLLNGST